MGKALPLGSAFSLSKNLFFDKLAEVNKAVKTSNSTPKCIWILERGELRSKSKSLAQPLHPPLKRAPFPKGEGITPHPSNFQDFATSLQGKGFLKTMILFRFLTIGGFFDTLNKALPFGSALIYILSGAEKPRIWMQVSKIFLARAMRAI